MGDASNIPASRPKADPAAIFVLVVALGVVFVIALVRWGLAAVIAGLVALLVVDVVGAFVWTCTQQILGRGEGSFIRRLLRNIATFYIRLLAVVQF